MLKSSVPGHHKAPFLNKGTFSKPQQDHRTCLKPAEKLLKTYAFKFTIEITHKGDEMKYTKR